MSTNPTRGRTSSSPVPSGIVFQGRMPLPPGINQSYKIVSLATRKGTIRRLGATEALEAFKHGASLMLRDKQSYLNTQVIQTLLAQKQKTPLAVALSFYYPTLWLRDVDGGIKAAMDATFEHLGLNDNLVVRVSAEKYVDKNDPRCEVIVSIVAQEVA